MDDARNGNETTASPSKELNLPIALQAAGWGLLGILLGVLSKYLDTMAINELPAWLQPLDPINFLNGFAPWIFIALCICASSKTPKHAAINVFSFFLCFVASYYLYSLLVAGFLPMGYAMDWAGFTVVSPALAYLFWHARGEGRLGIVLSAVAIAVMFNLAFAFGDFYLDPRGSLEVAVFFLTIYDLRREPKELLATLALAVPIALVLRMVLPVG